MTARPLRRIGPRRGRAKLYASKTECVRGHPFDGDNTGLHVCADGYRHRYCRQCARDYRARRNQLDRTTTEGNP